MCVVWFLSTLCVWTRCSIFTDFWKDSESNRTDWFLYEYWKIVDNTFIVWVITDDMICRSNRSQLNALNTRKGNDGWINKPVGSVISSHHLSAYRSASRNVNVWLTGSEFASFLFLSHSWNPPWLPFKHWCVFVLRFGVTSKIWQRINYMMIR